MQDNFEELGNVRGYSFNLVNLGVRKETNVIKRKLIIQLEGTVETLQAHSERTITKIYIGKTYFEKKEDTTLNHLNPKTWNMRGIETNWQHHSDDGKDGLVVLGTITIDTVPMRMSPHAFAITMKKSLIDHYITDSRMQENNTDFTARFTTEQLTTSVEDNRPYCVYMAFEYEKQQPAPPVADLRSLQLETVPDQRPTASTVHDRAPDQNSASSCSTNPPTPSSCQQCEKLKALVEKMFGELQAEVSSLKKWQSAHLEEECYLLSRPKHAEKQDHRSHK